MRYWLGRNTAKNFLFAVFLFLLFFVGTGFNKNTVLAQNKQSAVLSFSTLPKQIEEGERVTVDVNVSSEEQSINAISGVMSFPVGLLRVVSINKDNSIIKLWTQEPQLNSGNISFEGIILNPGFQGNNGLVFSVTFEAENSGSVNLNFSEGAILANDGLGTNILSTLGSTSFNIILGPNYFTNKPIAETEKTPTQQRSIAVVTPTITTYSSTVGPQGALSVKGQGEPMALTEITFQDLSIRSIGDKIIGLFQNKKNTDIFNFIFSSMTFLILILFCLLLSGFTSGQQHGRRGQRDGRMDQAADRHPQTKSPRNRTRT